MNKSSVMVQFEQCRKMDKAINVFVLRDKKPRSWESHVVRERLYMGFIIKRRDGVYDYCPISNDLWGVKGLTCYEMQVITERLMVLNGQKRVAA